MLLDVFGRVRAHVVVRDPFLVLARLVEEQRVEIMVAHDRYGGARLDHGTDQLEDTPGVEHGARSALRERIDEVAQEGSYAALRVAPDLGLLSIAQLRERAPEAA
jgi:hypothetical protein